MSAREQILKTLRENTRESYDMPDLDALAPITFPDPLAEFIHKTTTTAGARLIELNDGDDLNAVIRQAYPDAKVFASNVAGVQADINPDTVEDVRELMKVDVGVVEGSIGVAENACVWVPQTMVEKAVCFISENLVILLKKSEIVNNMHEAYKRIRFDEKYDGYGTFISGPSKTADIAQVLVMGAQAARSATILLLP